MLLRPGDELVQVVTQVAGEGGGECDHATAGVGLRRPEDE